VESIEHLLHQTNVTRITRALKANDKDTVRGGEHDCVEDIEAPSSNMEHQARAWSL
jgi:hypothetical protein